MLKKKLLGGLVAVWLVCLGFIPAGATDGKVPTDDKKFPSLLSNSSDAPRMRRVCDSLYDVMGLALFGLEREVFFRGYKGYQFLLSKGVIHKKNILSICDYSQSSNNKRLYVIDLDMGRLLYNTFVSHGKNSGGEYATSFSNLQSSNKSSLGFMVTAETYRGKAGYSMRFNGMEPGINNNVRSRDIVLHGSQFVNAKIMEQRGTIGNSLGCPAVPLAQHKQIIDAIKGGSCFFINHPDSYYQHTSTILNSKFDLDPAALTAEALAIETPAGNTIPSPNTPGAASSASYK